ncbi:MAG: dienelactone hydrolase family protein, partial [Verrucomicrobia bacterium]|nr:dienelactone hydrolase family protein [Verrucomicrobiota bacterium]
KEVALTNLGKINSPTLFVVGTADRFLPAVNRTVAILNDLGKDSSIDIYPGEKHGFYWGPRKQEGNYEPTPAFTKALNHAVTLFEDRVE